MQKRHFELIANVLKSAKENAKESTDPVALANFIALQFADRLSLENSRFDRDRFLKACGF